MAKQVIKAASLLLHSQQLAPLTNSIEFNVEGEKKVCTNFASEGWEESLLGIRATTLAAQLYFQNVEEPEATLATILESETSVPFTVTMSYPPVAGDLALFAKVVPLTLMRSLQVGEIYGGSMNFGPQAEAVRGYILENNTGRVATGDSAELEVAAVGAAERLWIAVHVFSVSGTDPELDLLIESDATGFATPTTRITVPTIEAAGSYITYVAGPITDDFFRVAATVGGTDTPTFAYLVAIGIAPAA